jgi:hypothetical protein
MVNDASDSKAASIGLQDDWFAQVEILEDQDFVKGLFHQQNVFQSQGACRSV